MKKFGVMVYVCADTHDALPDLEEQMRGDLAEMQAAGSTEEMAVCVQFDSWRDGLTRRYILPVAPANGDEGLRQILPDVDMGNPASLMAFTDWCMERVPAERYALIIGSHGSGPRADNLYAGRSAKMGMARAIAFDDSSKSFMDTAGLQRAIGHAAVEAGRNLMLVGFDACSMATVEIAEAMAPWSDFMVGSAEPVPGAGWPYAGILQDWAARVKWGTTSHALAGCVVSRFHEAYRDKDEGARADIMSVDLKRVPALLRDMDAAALELLKRWGADPALVGRARGTATTDDPDFAYVESLARNMQDYSKQDDARARLAAVTQHLDIADDEWRGKEIPRNARGLAVYFPQGPVAGWYSELPIAARPWGRLIREMCSG